MKSCGEDKTTWNRVVEKERQRTCWRGWSEAKVTSHIWANKNGDVAALCASMGVYHFGSRSCLQNAVSHSYTHFLQRAIFRLCGHV